MKKVKCNWTYCGNARLRLIVVTKCTTDHFGYFQFHLVFGFLFSISVQFS